MVTGYFLDTYAIIEFLKGNEKLVPYLSNEKNLTSVLNLIELYYYLLSRMGEATADEKTLPFFSISVNPRPLAIKNGMKFRLENRKKNLSYADCLGYALARENGLKFLTGDKQFKGLPNVEFVV